MDSYSPRVGFGFLALLFVLFLGALLMAWLSKHWHSIDIVRPTEQPTPTTTECLHACRP